MIVKNRIKSLVSAIDRKTGFKHLNLSSAIQTLCDGNAGTVTTNLSTETNSGVVLQSGGRLSAILDAINEKTGHSDSDITTAAQRLFNGYSAPTKLYSFGVLADLHLQYVTGVADFQRALTYLKDNVDFTCICGDLVAWAGTGTEEAYGTTDYMVQYKATVDGYADDMPIYEVAGNHETYPSQGVSGIIDLTKWTETTGKDLYYTFTHGKDVFIMLGLETTNGGNLFSDTALTWFENTLEENKNKRCFVFQHVPEYEDRTSAPIGYSDMLESESGKAFVAIMKNYPNAIWFHGHTHITLGVEQYPVADIEYRGYKSVHVPSLVSPRFYDAETNSIQDYYFDENNNKIWGSSFAEGYIVDVYENSIVLKGINFAAGTDKKQVQEMINEVYALDTTF